jgi:restriction system protein
MTDVSWKRTGELLHILFEVLHEHPEGLQAASAIKAVENRIELTDHESGYYEDGQRRFGKIMRFGTIGPVKAGWLVKQDGRWMLTDDGWKAHQKLKDPLELVKRSNELYKAWKKALPAAPEIVVDVAQEDEDASAAITLETAEDWARSEIERHVKSMDPYEFQRLIAGLLSAMDYHVAWVSPPGKDDGIDIVAYSDPLGTRPPRIKVQVKRHDKPVGSSDVAQFMGNLGGEDIGILVSTGNFSKDAESKARTDKQHRVTLIGLDALVKLWTQHYHKLDQANKQRLPLRPVYFIAPQG